MPAARTVPFCRTFGLAALAACISLHAFADARGGDKVFRAGAYAVDVSPERLPVLVNGGMYSRMADKIVDPLHARCLVLDDGTKQIAIAVVDSCMLPRDLLDEAKELAAKATGIPASRMLISATHTHSAPSAMGALGTDADEAYAKFLPARIARGIQLAQANLEPARVGWAKSRDPKNVYNRRWLMKEGTAQTNPFSGKTNDRAQMNPGPNNPNKIKQTGTVDDEVWVLSVQAKNGRPIALLANYSTHYAGSPALSADYFGVFAEKIGKLIGADAANGKPAFVGIMSNGTSGDANCVDFSRSEPRKFDYHSVAEDTARAAFEAYGTVKYYDWAPLAMEEALLTLNVRMPTENEVARAKEFLATDEGKKLQSVPAVYARETVLLSQMPPTRELKLQAIRIGELGIAAIPNEVFTATGLSIKSESPLPATFTIELANGAEGYIPPPEQHKLGGYTTWRARTSCLEEQAEPKIRAKVMELLGKVAAQPASGERKLPESGTKNAKDVDRNREHKQGADALRSPIDAPRAPAFRAGAYAIDITPTKFPVIVNGMFTERTAGGAADKLHARCLVLEDGNERIAIVIVDNLMMPRELLDEAKRLASGPTGIPVDKMLIAATHTHSAPSVMGCLGSGVDPEYPEFLIKQIARGIELASKNVQPAKLGYVVADARGLTHCRRWIRRPDAIGGDPFGEPTIRAMMHPGYQNPSYVGPAGPVDSQLSLVSIQSTEGEPLAVLANFSMHYFNSPLVSADYFGRFCEQLAKKIEASHDGKQVDDSPFVAIMSQGTSGDLHWMDYSRPQKRISLDEYSEQVADVAFKAWQTIEYRDDVSLAMAEAKLNLRRRTPDEKRLAWARDIVEKLEGRKPQSHPEVYAHEAIYLHEEPQRELILQAVRIGDVGIATFPNEVFGITGLKIKRQSPLAHTFNIELANGAEGYIPPPEQHRLGGYTTWPARTAGLEIEAEPKIVELLLRLLEEVAGEPRRLLPVPQNKYSSVVRAADPLAYWPLDDLGNGQDLLWGPVAEFQGGVALHLAGVPFQTTDDHPNENRAVQFAGGRIAAPGVFGPTYSIEFWLENRLPNDARPVTGYLFSRGPEEAKDCPGDHLGIMGTHDAKNAGRLFFYNGNGDKAIAVGKTSIAPHTWNHVALVRDGDRVQVYLNGRMEIDAEIRRTFELKRDALRYNHQLFFGGRSDNFANLAGKLDEVALFNRALTADEIAAHFAAAGFAASGERKLPESAPNEVKDADQNRKHKQGANAPRSPADAPDSPVSPADSLKYLHVRPGMKVELVAAEPLVRDPVAFDWGPDGKLWVVEYLDYPTGIDGQGKPGGRVVYLEDTSGDGRYDKSTVFLDGLNFPTGVMAWRGGVLITAAPDILNAEDTTGDGKADKRERLYTGFHEGNQQLRINGLRWGLDNWIYCASGSHHGDYGKDKSIKSAKTGELVHIGSRDFRIKPDEGLIEPVSGPSQFGRNRDAWGNWFGCQNSKPMWHYVLDDRYLRRNPHVAYPDGKVLISDVPGQRPVFPRSKPGKFFHASQAGRFTSACSAMIYCDDLLGEEFNGNSFVSEPVHNLVHREIVERDGVTFNSYKPKDEENAEFLASEDTWFRPTTIRTGPDGALWIADMYREIIEHPHWVSDNLKPIVDTRTGTEYGRIYRIYPENAKPRAVPRIDKLETIELAALLESPSATLRDMAHVHILTHKLVDAVGLLENLAHEGERAESRLQALCALDGLDELRSERLAAALRDDNVWVRREAVRLCERRMTPELEQQLLKVKANDSAVCLQLAYTLGTLSSDEAAEKLWHIAIDEDVDPFNLAAVLSSLNEANLSGFASRVFTFDPFAAPLKQPLAGATIETAIQLKQPDAIERVAATLTRPRRDDPLAYDKLQLMGLAVLEEALRKHMLHLEDVTQSDEILRDRRTALAYARGLLSKQDASVPLRAAAIALIGSSPNVTEDDLSLIASHLAAQAAGELQRTAVEAIAQTGSASAPQLLLAGWKSHGPRLRSQVLDVLLSRGAWAEALLAAIEKGEVFAADIDAARRERLLKSGNQAIRAKAARLLAGSGDADRAKVVAQYKPILASLSSSDAERGKEIFAKRCSACHRVENVGNQVGPDLAGLTDKSPANLLTEILDPNRAVEPAYVSYTAVTAEGRVYNGMLADESGGSITLLDAEGKRHQLLRRDLEELRASGKSLMPEGLERDISPDEMRDLLAYLQAALTASP